MGEAKTRVKRNHLLSALRFVAYSLETNSLESRKLEIHARHFAKGGMPGEKRKREALCAQVIGMLRENFEEDVDG